jgi:hypothetical protein
VREHLCPHAYAALIIERRGELVSLDEHVLQMEGR